MKRIIFVFLFFCLTITTILAQVVITNIAAPNSNGLSNNQVDDFDVTSDGTILNNSASDGTATLGSTAVTGNGNITAGSEANLILFQVTGSTGSDLEGTIEVFGGEAGLIIANPNGIACDGCGFINTNRVDLVTGTANFSGDDLTDFSINGSSTLTVSGDGFVSDAVADELNLTSRDLRINAQAKANNTLRVLAGNETYNHTTNIINSDDTEATAHSISISASGYLEANYIELISTEISSGGTYGIVNYGRDISADRLRLDSNGLFRNQDAGGVVGNINISGLLEVINAERFINNGNITADTLTITTDEFFNNHNGGTQLGKIVVTDIFSLSTSSASYTNTGTVSVDTVALSIAGDFDYASDFLGTGNIDANNQYFTIRNGNFNNTASIVLTGNLGVTADKFNHKFGSSINVYNFNVTTAKDLIINSPVTADNFNATVGGSFYHDSGTISADNFNVTVEKSFVNFAPINADNFNVTVGKSFKNYSDVISNIISISAESFINVATPPLAPADGTISADTFALSVAGDFDYIAEYLDNGIITTNALNLQVGGNFSNNDSASNFTWATNDNLAVLGNADITTDNYIQNGAIDVAGVLTITANNFTYNSPNDDFIWDTNDILVVLGTFDITTNNFVNGGTISADTFAISVAGDFNYSSDFLNNGTNTADNLNFTARNGAFTNDTTIDLAGNLTITANTFTNTGGVVSADTLALSVAGDFDYIAEYLNNGTITADTLNLSVGGNFSYDDSASNFTWDTQNSLTVLGTANIVAASFNNSGIINVTNSSFDITATDFTNSGTINADTLALSVAGDFDYIAEYLDNGNITTNALNLQVGGNFSYNDSASDLNWGDNDILTVSGNASIDAASFNNSGTITVTNSSFNITATDFTNSGTISANTTLNTTVTSTESGSFANTGGVVSAETFSLSVAGDFDYVVDYLDNGTITTNTLNLTVGGDFSNNSTTDDFVLSENESISILGDFTIATNNYIQFGTLEVNGALAIEAESNFNNSGSINVTGSGSLAITAGYTAINQGSIVSNSLDLTAADFFRNLTGGDINVADDLNITAGGKVTNTANITVGTLTITANNDSTRNDDPAGAFFYVSNRGNITAGSFTIEAVDNFYNRGNITATNFTTSAKSVFFLNKEIDSFYAAGHTYDGGTIILGGTSGLITDGGIIENYGNIDLSGFDLTIVADSFTNHADAIIDANTLNLTVNSFVNGGIIDATIDHQ